LDRQVGSQPASGPASKKKKEKEKKEKKEKQQATTLALLRMCT
jgi:hypothetical protein